MDPQNTSDLWYSAHCVQESVDNWDTGGERYPALDLVPGEQDSYQPHWRYDMYAESSMSPYSAQFNNLFVGSSPSDSSLHYDTPITVQQCLSLSNMPTGMRIQAPHYADLPGGSFCSQDSLDLMTHSFSLPKSSPFPFLCPASNPQTICPCTNKSHEALLELPYKPHLSAKPLRAAQYPCRESLLERFPFGYRDLVAQILSDPISHIPLLMHLVVRYDKETSGNRFGCICCPNARFQAAAKAERHLRGLFDIRTVPCQYCLRLSIHRDDNKDHEKKCPWNKHNFANTLSHLK